MPATAKNISSEFGSSTRIWSNLNEFGGGEVLRSSNYGSLVNLPIVTIITIAAVGVGTISAIIKSYWHKDSVTECNILDNNHRDREEGLLNKVPQLTTTTV